MTEEIPKPVCLCHFSLCGRGNDAETPSFQAVNGPKIMIMAVLLGATTSWIFIVVLLFCLTDFQTAISSATGPLLQIYYQATSSRTGATCLLIFNIGAMALFVWTSYFPLHKVDRN